MGDQGQEAVNEWVLLSSLYDIVNRELGVSPADALATLHPLFESLHIHAEVYGLPDVDYESFAIGRWIFEVPNAHAPRVTKEGWRILAEDGRLAGYEVRIRWAHVVEALSHLKPQPALEAELAAPEKPVRRRLGGLNYEVSDRPLVGEMRALILSGAAKNPWRAALMVADRAEGSPQVVSKAQRLLGRFRLFRPEHDRKD